MRITSCVAAAVLALSCTAVLAHAGHDHSSHGNNSSHAAMVSSPPVESAAAPPNIQVSECWIRALPNRLPAAAYFRVSNTGDQPARLVGVQADGFGKVMLHSNDVKGGMARMMHVHDVVLAPGQTFEFAPRGHHVMLEQAEFDLEVGTSRPIVLWFDGPAALKVDCEVRAPGTLN